MKQPLAFRMRPESLDEVIGQQHLIGPGQVLRRCVEEGRLFSMGHLSSGKSGERLAGMSQRAFPNRARPWSFRLGLPRPGG